jgi:hypothetical protein
MKSKDLEFIFDTSIKNFNSYSSSSKFDGDPKVLDHRQLVALAYYESVVLYLVKSGALPKDFDSGISFIEEGSGVNEDDY